MRKKCFPSGISIEKIVHLNNCVKTCGLNSYNLSIQCYCFRFRQYLNLIGTKCDSKNLNRIQYDKLSVCLSMEIKGSFTMIFKLEKLFSDW